MSAGWVAGSVRGRLLTRRRLGVAGAREVAASGGVEAAVLRLSGSPYGRDVHQGLSVEDARRAIGSVCLWHLRVLAGWLPPRGGEAVRVFGARFELVNIADRLAGPGVGPPPYELGALAVAWPRVAMATTADEVRAVLAGSAWGDPGDDGLVRSRDRAGSPLGGLAWRRRAGGGGVVGRGGGAPRRPTPCVRPGSAAGRSR